VGLVDDLERIAEAAARHAQGSSLSAVLPTEPAQGLRSYVCAFERGNGERAWLVLDDVGQPVIDRRDARDAVSIAALCELAEEAAFPGDLDELRAELVALRIAEAPAGIDEAEAAAAELQRAIGAPPAIASPERLDRLGQAALRLERALDPTAASPFAAVMRSAQAVVDELWSEVEASYGVALAPAPLP
jgi:hypothetical protein